MRKSVSMLSRAQKQTGVRAFRQTCKWPVFLFYAALCLLAAPASQRDLLLPQMSAHPDRAWPRGAGHIVYAWPGTTEWQKSYIEPAGSFSPVPGSFGLSLDDAETVPAGEIRQRFEWARDSRLPLVITSTKRFREVLWSNLPGHWFVSAASSTQSPLRLSIRSAGPAGGAIHSLENRYGRLLIENRWVVVFSPPAVSSRISDEGPKQQGWRRADVTLPAKSRIEITDLRFGPVYTLPYGSTRALDKWNFSDPRFAACLNAQIANLMMSLVRNETRPGDPLNCPLAWLRDGAYVVVALARAGQIDLAKSLCAYFAEHDFFGGFGSEADAPGLSLWAIGQTASLAHDPAFTARMWPAVRRRAEFIIRMRHTNAPIREPWFGPIVPAHRNDNDLDLVCDPARSGLIIGRMDFHQPVLFVNAVSFAGLREASGMAGRLGARADAARWQAEARDTQIAWEQALRSKESDDERVFASALWPSEIGVKSKALLKHLMSKRWKRLRTPDGGFRQTPLWTYFSLAEAHNWLELGDRAKAEDTVRWFLAHQASPGFYTWWEGSGEENSFHLWNQVRGWAKPQYVTPHYWTAAEMALLLMDLGRPGNDAGLYQGATRRSASLP
jgi:hypothetical protein